MNNCITCRYAIRDPLWTDYKCALKRVNIRNPEEYGCLSYEKNNRKKPPHHHGRKPEKLGSPISKNIIENGTFYAEGDKVIGYRSVTVKVPGGTTIDKTITENGTYNAIDYDADGFKTVVVDIPDIDIGEDDVLYGGAAAGYDDEYRVINGGTTNGANN